jgi:hypothetical protein
LGVLTKMINVHGTVSELVEYLVGHLM